LNSLYLNFNTFLSFSTLGFQSFHIDETEYEKNQFIFSLNKNTN